MHVLAEFNVTINKGRKDYFTFVFKRNMPPPLQKWRFPAHAHSELRDFNEINSRGSFQPLGKKWQVR